MKKLVALRPQLVALAVVLVLIGLVNSSAAAVDAALIASVLGILATVALARILTKGRR